MISVIIPVFNMEKYLHRCVDSVLSQSFEDFELIMVDDGSNDASSSICDNYAKADDRVIVIHQENQGVSAARNVGLDRCKGEWVCFIDADDVISENYLSVVKGCDSDIVIVEIATITPEQKVMYGISIPQQKVSKDELKSFFTLYIYEQPLRVPWAKFFRKSCIGETRFVVRQRLGEDTVFDYTIFRICNSIEVRHGYYYFVQQGELGNDNDFIKYRMPAADAAICLSNIYYSFINLDLPSRTIQNFWYFDYFFKICDKRWGHSCRAWFISPVVKELEKVKFATYSKKDFLLLYYVWSIPFLGNIVEQYRECRSFLRKLLVKLLK